MIGLSQIEEKLLSVGLAGMTLDEKNTLITVIAKKEGKTYFEVNEEFILEYHKQIKIDSLSEISDDTIIYGFVSSNGHTYRTNRDDQINMIGKAVQTIFDSNIETINWKTEDIGYVELPKDDWIGQVFMEGLTHKELTLHKYNTLKAQVDQADTEAELLSIVWEGVVQ